MSMEDLFVTQAVVASAGTTLATSGTVIFSNANNVSFGLDGQTLTASVAAPGGGGVAISAGTQSVSTGTVVFSNSNGITFGMAGSSRITASYTVPTQSVQPGLQSISAGTTRITTGEVILSDSNGISFGVDGQTITASYTVPSTAGLISNINVSAGTTSNDLTNVIFSNSNNVSFGLDGSTITASVTVATSLTNIRVSAGTTSNLLSAITFSNSNNVSFGLNGSTLTASVTVASTQGSVNLSAGTTSNLASAFTFEDANGISFGLDAGTLTASHNGLTSQSNQAVSANNGSFAFQTLSFSNANAVSFGTSAGSAVTASVALFASVQDGAFDFATVTFGDQGNVSFRRTGAAGIKASAFANVSAGTTSNWLSVITLSNSHNVSFGLNGSTLTASASFPAQTPFGISAGTQSVSTGTLVFSNSNRMTFGMSGSSRVTGSFNIGITLTSNTSNAVQTQVNELVIAGRGDITVGLLDGGTLYISGTQSTGPGGIAAGGVTATSGTVIFSNSNGVSFGLNGQTMTASHNGITSQTNQQMTLFATGNTTQSSTGTTNASSLIFRGEGGVSVGITNGSVVVSAPAGGVNVAAYGVSNLGNSAGDTGTRTGTMVFVGSNHITLSQATGAATNTISIIGRDAVFGAGVSNGGNTEGDTGTRTGTIVFQGGNNITLSQITGAASNTIVFQGRDIPTSFIQAMGVSTGGNTAGNTGLRSGAMVLVGLHGITLSQTTGAVSNTVSIMGPRLSIFSHPGDWHATNFSISNATLSLHKFSVPNVISATRIQVLMDLTGNTNSSGALSMSFGIYTVSGSTASLASSGSRQLSWTSGSETSASTRYGGVSGTQYRTMALNATIQPGDYLLGVWFRTTNNGTWRIFGRPAANIVNLHEGTDAWIDGTSSASFTTAMPSSIHLSNYEKTGAAAIRQPGFILLGTV